MNRHSCAWIYKHSSQKDVILKKPIQRIPSSHNFAHNAWCFPPLRHTWFLFESLGCSSKSSEPFAQAHLLGKPPRATRTRSSSAGPTQVDDFVWMKSQTSVQGIDGTGDDIAPELSIEFCVVSRKQPCDHMGNHPGLLSTVLGMGCKSFFFFIFLKCRSAPSSGFRVGLDKILLLPPVLVSLQLQIFLFFFVLPRTCRT